MTELGRFKFVTTLVVVSQKTESDGKRKYDTLYWHSNAQSIISESDIDDVFEPIYTTII